MFLVALASIGFTSTIQAGLTGSLTSQTFTPKDGTKRAKLEQTLLVSDGKPSDDGVLPWATSTTSKLTDFLNEGDGHYYVELTLHVRNQRNGPTPGLGFKSVGVQLLDVAGLPLNGTDKLYFGDGPNVETTSFFLTAPTFGDPPPEDLIWKDGLLPATNPFTEATFKMLIHLDATENFGGNGQGDFSMDMALTVSTVPEPSSTVLVIVGLACSACLLRGASRPHQRASLANLSTTTVRQ
jgi:hypothetical protein